MKSCFRPVLLTLSYAYKSLGDVQVLIQEVSEGTRDCSSYKISGDADAVTLRLLIHLGTERGRYLLRVIVILTSC